MSNPQATSSPGRPTVLRAFTLGSSSAHHRPRAPLSPPETERSVPAALSLDRGSVDRTLHTVEHVDKERLREEGTTRHLRRKPSLSYNQLPAPARQPPARKWLLVVTPPGSLNTEPVLGHTLAHGPPGRFQSGILMPLYSTMYAQLSAISREFNLPSIVGVCLYLHVNQAGLNIAPRISDEAWQFLWGPYLGSDENSPALPGGIPVCGQIEFDIDIRKARWYDAWVNGVSLDTSIPPSVAHTMTRWYNEHREAGHEEAETDGASTTQRPRPILRPLALSTLHEAQNKTAQKYRAINSMEGVVAESIGSKRHNKRLSPVIQVDEPAVIQQQKDLDTLVRNWRATTPMGPAMPITEVAAGSVPDTYDTNMFSDIDMEDYEWAVSSTGPPSQWPASPAFDRPLRSVDLEGRMAGSVALTPSVATSFGPDDSLATPATSNVVRYPSPDIAGRLLEDSPPTPTTATSWGAPSVWPLSPPTMTYIHTPDVAARGYISVPNTPTTATSWGAPSVWPETPFSSFKVRTPDVATRMYESVPSTPTTATSWGAPEVWPPSPVEISRPATPGIADRVDGDEEEVFRFVWPFYPSDETRPSNSVWPFFMPESHETSYMGWPFYSTTESQCYSQTIEASSSNAPLRETQRRTRDLQTIYRQSESETTPSSFAWPFFTASPSAASVNESMTSGVYPHLVIYPPIYPRLEISSGISCGSAELPRVQKTPFVGKVCPSYAYPDILIYNAVGGSLSSRSETLPMSYGHFNLYPDVYPSIVPYPPFYEACVEKKPPSSPSSSSKEPLGLPTRLNSQYPLFDLYPALYPSIVVYPSVKLAVEVKLKAEPIQSLHLKSCYPNLVIYRPVYPVFDIYPACEITSTKSKEETPRDIKVTLMAEYPNLVIYPAVYPSIDIYPAAKLDESQASGSQEATQPAGVRIPSHYPNLVIYPAVYPTFDIYPATTVTSPAEDRAPLHAGSKMAPIRLPVFYPNLDIYAPAYPYFDIYPAVPTPPLRQPIVPSFSYPHIVIYEPLRTINGDGKAETKAVNVRLAPSYPIFDLYPAGYPHLVIYPSVAKRSSLSISVHLGESANRLQAAPLSPRRSRRTSNPWVLEPLRTQGHSRRLSNVRIDRDLVAPVSGLSRAQHRTRESISDLYQEGMDPVLSSLESASQAVRRQFVKEVAPALAARKVSSARVDGVQSSLLGRAKTFAAAPPVPAIPVELRHKLSLTSLSSRTSS